VLGATLARPDPDVARANFSKQHSLEGREAGIQSKLAVGTFDGALSLGGYRTHAKGQQASAFPYSGDKAGFRGRPTQSNVSLADEREALKRNK